MLAVACSGCQRSPEFVFVPIEGTITRHGQPLPGVRVSFYTDAGTHGPLTTGITDAAGRYRLHTYAGEKGAVLGHHRVCLSDEAYALRAQVQKKAGKGNLVKVDEEDKLFPTDLPSPATPRLPSAYCRVGETPLRAEVRPDSQVIDFDIP